MPRLYFPAVSSELLDYGHLPTVHHVTEQPLVDVNRSSTRLQLILAEYTVDGQFRGYQSVQRGRVQLCRGPDSSVDAAYDIGVDYRQQVKSTLLLKPQVS